MDFKERQIGAEEQVTNRSQKTLIRVAEKKLIPKLQQDLLGI